MTTSTEFWRSLYQQSQRFDLQHKQVENMQLNHNLTQSAYVNSASSTWLPSPAKGVKRLVLEREGGEKTLRATSIVAYDPNSKFAPHQHPMGEEFFVLTGTFSDELGDYPAGTYVRNPPNSSHQPFSNEGCMIWVKLQQFEASDSQHVVIDTNKLQENIVSNGLSRKVLFDQYETVEMVTAESDTTIPQAWFESGLEILVLSGQLTKGDQSFKHGNWLRIAAGETHNISVALSSKLIVKRDHLG